jgi:hypothetical protein
MSRQSRKQKPRPVVTDDLETNVSLLLSVWEREWSFHDMVISSILRISGRVVITLDDLVLVLTGVTQYTSNLAVVPDDEFSEIWVTPSLTGSGETRTLRVETEGGHFEATFHNLRLIRPHDHAVLIPSIDD